MPDHKTGSTGTCIRCKRKFVKNYADHKVCEPGCDGGDRHEMPKVQD